MTPRNVGKKWWDKKIGIREWGVGDRETERRRDGETERSWGAISLVLRPSFSPSLYPDRRSSTRSRTHARREMARGFAVSVRRASEAPQKSLLQNLGPTVRPRDSRNHRVDSETFRFGDQIGASASDGDDRRPAHQNFVQCSENLSSHALSIF